MPEIDIKRRRPRILRRGVFGEDPLVAELKALSQSQLDAMKRIAAALEAIAKPSIATREDEREACVNICDYIAKQGGRGQAREAAKLIRKRRSSEEWERDNA